MEKVVAGLVVVALAIGAPAARADEPCAARATQVLASLQKGDDVAATDHFDQRMRAALGGKQLLGIWQRLPAQFGAFQRAGTVLTRTESGHPVAEIPLRFANGNVSMTVACDGKGAVGGLHFVPGAAASTSLQPLPGGFRQQALAVPTPLGPLRGILALPAGKGPFPAVLLVPGSGPQDADETIGPNKPFVDLAQGLAAAGIATFRYDKRSLTYGTQVSGNQHLTIDEEVTDDALSALKVLDTQPAIDDQRVFVLGHSLGALMTPRIAGRAQHPAGAILLAPPERFGLGTLVRQVREIGQQQGVPAEQLDQQVKELQQAQAMLSRADPAHPPAGTFAHAPASYWLSLRHYDAIDAARDTAVPFLVMHGLSDFNVTPAEGSQAWHAAFASDSRVTLKTYPGLSHLFMPAGNPPGIADFTRPGHVDATVVHDIVTWIRAH